MGLADADVEKVRREPQRNIGLARNVDVPAADIMLPRVG